MLAHLIYVGDSDCVIDRALGMGPGDSRKWIRRVDIAGWADGMRMHMNVLVHCSFQHRTHRAPGMVVQIEQIVI